MKWSKLKAEHGVLVCYENHPAINDSWNSNKIFRKAKIRAQRFRFLRFFLFFCWLLAPREGFEPSTYRLTAERSTTELTGLNILPITNSHGFTLLMVRGNGMASRILSSLSSHRITRSAPIPNPEWGTLPYLRRLIYHS